jgi:hypothetical protein
MVSARYFGNLVGMRCWLGSLSLAALAAGARMVGTGCGSSTTTHNKDAGGNLMWSSATDMCATRTPPTGGFAASSATGSVTVNRSSSTIDIDAVVAFPSSDAGPAQSVEMKAQGVPFMLNC